MFHLNKMQSCFFQYVKKLYGYEHKLYILQEKKVTATFTNFFSTVFISNRGSLEASPRLHQYFRICFIKLTKKYRKEISYLVQATRISNSKSPPGFQIVQAGDYNFQTFQIKPFGFEVEKAHLHSTYSNDLENGRSVMIF